MSKEVIKQFIQKIDAAYKNGALDELNRMNIHLKNMAVKEEDEEAFAIARYNDTYQLDKEQKLREIKDILEDILPVFLKYKTNLFLIRSYNMLGIITSELGEYYDSVQFYLNAYHISMRYPECGYSCAILINIGNLFVWLKEYETALAYILQGYAVYQAENMERQNVINTIVVDIMECYSLLDKFELVEEWKQYPVSLSEEDNLIMNHILYANDIRKAYFLKDYKTIQMILPNFLDTMNKSSDYIYSFRAALQVLEICIHVGDQEACKMLLHSMDEKNALNSIASFLFDYAELKVLYAQKFHDKVIVEETKDFLEDYFKESQKSIAQFHKTYSNNIITQIQLNKAYEDKEQVDSINTQLEKSLQLDRFTQLYNKIAFKTLVKEKQKLRSREKGQALLILDIDHFKKVNDQYGHNIGDAVLLKVASLLKQIASDTVLTGRFGGDEFIVYLYNLDADEDLYRVLDELLSEGSRIEIPQSDHQCITLSIGAINNRQDTYDALFMKADDALYECKSKGRNRYNVY